MMSSASGSSFTNTDNNNRDIVFGGPFNTSTSTDLELINNTDQCVAFQMRVSNPEYFRINPEASGYVDSHQKCQLKLTLLKNFDRAKKYKMLLQTTFVSNEVKATTDHKSFWKGPNTWVRDVTNIRICVRLMENEAPEESKKMKIYLEQPLPLPSAALLDGGANTTNIGEDAAQDSPKSDKQCQATMPASTSHAKSKARAAAADLCSLWALFWILVTMVVTYLILDGLQKDRQAHIRK